MVERRKIIVSLMMAFIMVFLITGCGETSDTSNSSDSEVQLISSTAAEKLIADEPDLFILDVRTQEEYDEGHLKNSVLVPIDVLEDQIEKAIPDKDTKVLVYCRTGNRSGQAALTMLGMGYTDLYDLDGGIVDWNGSIEK